MGGLAGVGVAVFAEGALEAALEDALLGALLEALVVADLLVVVFFALEVVFVADFLDVTCEDDVEAAGVVCVYCSASDEK